MSVRTDSVAAAMVGEVAALACLALPPHVGIFLGFKARPLDRGG